MVDIVCETCRKVFTIKRVRADRGRARFCSVPCRYAFPHKPRKLSSHGVDEARRLRAEGVSWTSIARELGHSKEYWQRRLDPDYNNRWRELKKDWRADHMKKKSAPVPPVILSDEIIAEIRQKHALGIRLTAIPAVLSVRGISHKAIAAVIEGRA